MDSIWLYGDLFFLAVLVVLCWYYYKSMPRRFKIQREVSYVGTPRLFLYEKSLGCWKFLTSEIDSEQGRKNLEKIIEGLKTNRVTHY